MTGSSKQQLHVVKHLSIGARNHRQRSRRDQMLEIERALLINEIVAGQRNPLIRPRVAPALASVVCSSIPEKQIGIVGKLLSIKHARSLLFDGLS